MTGVGRGSGKLILCGEHAVVYGHPAIAFAVDRGTTVDVVARRGPTMLDADQDDARLLAALHTVVPPDGWAVKVRTDLPIGRGMGSSAALAVGLVRALAAARGESPDDAAVEDAAMPLERAFHGNPSGLDVALSARGGIARYRRGPPRTLEPLPVPGWSVVVLDSGEAGNTAELVAGVAARRPGVDRALERIGALVAHAEAVLADPAALGPVLDENHALLREIGVSTPRIDELVALAKRAGALGAKLSGAGGGGVVLALAPRGATILSQCLELGIDAWECRPWTRE